MAVGPLFVASMTVLKTRLRLEKVSATGALAKVDQAVEDARRDIYLRLGPSLISTISATAYVEAPTTTAQYQRSAANSLEIDLVDRYLLRRLKTSFLDGSGDRGAAWNEFGGGYRELTAKGVQDELNRLDSDIEKLFQFLEGTLEVTEDTTAEVFDGTPEEDDTVQPWDAIYGGD